MDTIIRERVDALDWDALRERLDADGHAITPPLLDRDETEHLAGLFDDGRFRSTIDMARHRFGEGDWNALHQDLYGDVYFPFQILTVVADDFEGGEFVLMEQRPRAQSRAHVLRPPRGAFVIFPTRERPNRGRTGYHRVGMRHGIGTVTRGQRTALGIIFHDAR